MTTALSVNLNKIALLRNSREGNYPSVIEHGKRCIQFGAHGITVHPRPDQRHIRPHDVDKLGELCQAYKNIEFNIEGNPFSPSLKDYPGLLALALRSKPDQCTLVPDSHEQLTSDHGFDLKKDADRLAPIIEELHANNIRVSLFMDPVIDQIAHAKEIGADRIELYTGPFAHAYANQNDTDFPTLLQHYTEAAQHAKTLGLGVNAGHDLNLKNLRTFLTKVPHIAEVSIGHALTVEALEFGLEDTIARYCDICRDI